MGDREEMVEINMTSSVELSSSLLEQLEEALIELETHNAAFSTQVPWNDAHFRNLESRTKKTFEELEAKEKDFTARESHYHMLFAEKEAEVVAKEQDLLDQVQELKDAAVAAITKARENHKVSSFVDDENASIDTQERKPPHKMGGNVEGVAAKVNPCAELTQFCEQMDSIGLLKFVMENLENLSSLWKEQLSVALGIATEPACLVLDALAGFSPPKEMTQEVDLRDAALHGMRQSCLILMEALSAFLSKADCDTDSFLNPETQQQAKVIANVWKLKLAGESINAANENSLEAEGFLHCKYVLAVAHHRQATELCRYLGLTQKIPGLVDTLISNGRQIDAVHFIHAFKLSEAFPPVPLLRAYLKELRRNSQGNGSAALQNDYNARELEALRAVIACVEQYKLEADYPLDPLHKRVAQLDKSVRGDTKRTAETGYHQHHKKPKGDRGFQGQRARGFGRGRHGPPPRASYTGVTGRPERPRGPYSPAAPSYGSNMQPSHQPYA
ncbi:FRIGIDA-like protein 3 isoform X2 [Chenopodium quinoa]|uniref:FRIGIDA-like protein 3 isoform X2 n=1 Tax=Chenopodium quinoa TaxID=63459 RepID=UPI000B78B549|nr:FRIGIDA-like protein 3 isoform X2 [Chenopodium quinoa]